MSTSDSVRWVSPPHAFLHLGNLISPSTHFLVSRNLESVACCCPPPGLFLHVGLSFIPCCRYTGMLRGR